MSENVESKGASPVRITWGLKPSENKDKENLMPSALKKSEKRVSISSMEVDDRIRAIFEPTGSIPKRFGEVKNRSTSHNSSLQRVQGQDRVFTKTRFHVFNESKEEKELEESKKLTTRFMRPLPLDGQLPSRKTFEAFSKAKNFFQRRELAGQEMGVEKEELEKSEVRERPDGRQKRTFRRLARLHSIDEAARAPIPQIIPARRVNQLIREHFEPTRVTPHDVPPPKPPKIKVLHRSTHDHNGEEVTCKCPLGGQIPQINLPYPDEVMLFEEEKNRFRNFTPNYRHLNASSDQRQTVVHFLLRIGSHNGLPSHMIYQTVRIFDDVLQAKRIPVQKLQLIMIAALWIVMKKDYIVYRIPGAKRMAHFADGVYTEDDVRAAEGLILQALNFWITYPDPFSMLTYFILTVDHSDFIGCEEREKIYYFGGYMLDLALLDDDLMKICPILLTATAAELAITLVMEPESTLYCTPFTRWRTKYAFGKLKDEEINCYRNLLIRNIAESCYRSSKSHVVHKKYSKSRYGKVAKKLIDKIQKLLPPNI
ncbi:uncharacterized protein [Fopius arisanus]|uniref:Uncharacterized protein isoform X1 n=2 Tax=Fopius arisanus TaxID=64838 RepID=A0A9R1U8U4_9HYME|nr:PREDICTED: uncharacterized protein LOC105271639 isoform X1 [Fopius arisanus]